MRALDAPQEACADVNHLIDDQLSRLRARLISMMALEKQLLQLRSACSGEHAHQSCGILNGLVAAALVVLALVIARFPLPALGGETQRLTNEVRKTHSLWRHRNLVFGVPAIFIYLIAEIGVANLFVNFVSQPNIANLTHEQAGKYLAFLWGGMMIGRFAGSAIMQKVDAAQVLAGFAVGAFVVMLITVFSTGPIAMWSLILVGLFHSIMFPTIFTLGIRGLGPLTEEGSGLMIMAIAGGALVVVQGYIADRYGLQTSFLLTAACELYVLFYALWGCRPTHSPADPHVDAS